VGTVAEEVRRQEFPGVSPWDVLVWKLDSIEKQIAKVEQRMDRLEQRIDRLEHRFDGLDQRIGGLDSRTVHSYTMLQWTAIIGFLAVIAALLGIRFL